MKAVLIVLGLLCLLSLAIAHKLSCGTVDNPEQKEQFEKWMSIHSRKRQSAANYNIRVLFTVIHSGEPIGEGDNLDPERFNEQITILNEGFNGTYGGVASGISFSLYGINRYNYNDFNWTAPPYTSDYFDRFIKPVTIYKPDFYLNTWSARIQNLLGYATFPELSGLPGIGFTVGKPKSDGVVLLAASIGVNNDSLYTVGFTPALGRTGVHEFGHFFGLRHIWGDGDCSATDYCDDTPPASRSFRGCPVAGVRPVTSCPGEPDAQVTNFMDYADDVCNLQFTNDQVTRMRTVLQNSPRRASLTMPENNATLYGGVAPSNLGFSLIPNLPGSDYQFTCSNTYPLSVILSNTNPNPNAIISTVTIQIIVDNYSNLVLNQTLSVNLGGGQSTILNFTVPLTLDQIPTVLSSLVAYNNYTVSITDGVTTLFNVIATDPSSLYPNQLQTFDSTTSFPPERWLLLNPEFPWGGFTLTQSDGTSGTSAGINTFESPNYGLSRLLSTLAVSVNSPAVGGDQYIQFDYAYTTASALNTTASATDSLSLYALNLCSNTTTERAIWNMSGAGLETSARTQESFVPSGGSDWRTATVRITDSTLYGQLVSFGFAFRRGSDVSNNLYVDNFRVVTVAGNVTSSVSASPRSSSATRVSSVLNWLLW